MTADAMTFAEAEAALEAAEFVGCQTLWHSSNYVFLATLALEGGRQLAAIYKPLRGESPLWDFPDGLYRREVAAYRFARLLGWDFVPPTVLRKDGPEGVGSLQLFIPHDPAEHFFIQRDRSELVPQLKRMAAFDFAANNADRKGGHCLLDEDGRIWGIDHGLCFHEQYKLRTVIWDWIDCPIDEALLADLARARDAVEARDESAAPLLALVSKVERTALLGRIGKLLSERTLPKPGPHRSHPWPLV